jgi:hypothetical protein
VNLLLRIVCLLGGEQNPNLKSGAFQGSRSYRTHKKLTPKQAFVVFWRLKRNGIDHAPSFFNVTLRKKRYVQDLKEMETSRVHFFWSALTSNQRRLALEFGHTSPPAATATS